MSSNDEPVSPPPTEPTARRRSRKTAITIAGFALGGELLALRRRGYGLGGNVVVRCRRGHLFSTIWIPGGSLKAIRLGWARVQRCPVGGHWSLVTLVRLSELTDEERQSAAQHRDMRIP